MKRIYIYLRRSMKMLSLFSVKLMQMIRSGMSLLWPDKTLTSRLCFGMAFVCLVVFMVNTLYTIGNLVSDVAVEVNERNNTEINMTRFVCDQAQASEDTITVDALFDMLRAGGINEDVKISLVNENDTVVASSDSTWKGKYLNANIERRRSELKQSDSDDFSVMIDSSALYLQTINDVTYSCTADTIAGTPYKVVLAQSLMESIKTTLHTLLDICKFSGICLLLLVVFYIIILASLRYQTRNNVEIMGELGVAKQVQQQMLENDFSRFPEPHGYDLHCSLVPAKLMGGDLYDYVLKDDKLFFCIGDVSGKGVPAAIFMSAARVLFRHVLNYTSDTSEIASAINKSLADGNDSNMFCTMFIGMLDMNTNVLTYCNAGHNRPVVVWADGRTEFLETLPNIALGLMDDMPFVNQSLEFEEGMTLYAYTDGVTEAESVNKELFGDDNLLWLIRKNADKTPRELNAIIMKQLNKHTVMADQSDDITMVSVRRGEFN